MFLLQANNPIVVRVIEEPATKGTSLSDIIFGALGLSGILLIAAALLGLVLGGILIGLRILRDRGDGGGPEEEHLHVTPVP